MQIEEHKIDELNRTVSIKIEPEDYESKVKKILNDYQKKANMPGFRPGKVPFGMIRKMYGKSVMAEEVNKMLVDKLYHFIDDNKLPVLGNPLPKEKQKDVDLETQDEFEFEYELGLAPEFDVNVSEKDKFNYYKIKVDDELLDKYTRDIAKRFGQVQEVEESSENDMISAEFQELDKKGNIVAEGIHHTATVAIEYVEDKKAQEALMGLKKDDTLTVDPVKLSKGTADLAAMLNIPKSKAEKLDVKCKLTVKSIYRMQPAEVNQELYDKAFGPGVVNSKEEFREKLTEELEKALAQDSEKFLKKEVGDTLMKKLKLELPDEFLKRWLLETNKEKFDEKKIEDEYEDFAKNLRWQLIEDKLIKNNNLEVSKEEAEARAKELFKQQMAQYGYPEVPEEQLNEAAASILAKEEESKRIYQDIMDRKVLLFLKDTLTLKEKEVTFDEFVKIAEGKPGKGKILETLNNLVSFK